MNGEVKFVPCENKPGHIIVDHFICPEGHEVIGHDKRRDETVKIVNEPDTIECPECEEEYRMEIKTSVVPVKA